MVDAGDAAAAACRLHSEQDARNGLAQLETDPAGPVGRPPFGSTDAWRR